MSQFLDKINSLEKKLRDRLSPSEKEELDRLTVELKDTQILVHWNKGYTPGLKDRLTALREAKRMRQMHISEVTEDDIINGGQDL